MAQSPSTAREIGVLSATMKHIQDSFAEHKQETEAHRDRVHEQFKSVNQKIDGVDRKIDDLGDKFNEVANRIEGGKGTLKWIAAVAASGLFGSATGGTGLLAKALAAIGIVLK